MERGVPERDTLLRRDIAAISSEQFEQLVFELAHRDEAFGWSQRHHPPYG